MDRNLASFTTKEVGLVLIESLRNRFFRIANGEEEGLGVSHEFVGLGEALWGDDGVIQCRKRQRELEGHFIEPRLKKQNLDDSVSDDGFGSSNSWVSKEYGNNDQEVAGGGPADVNNGTNLDQEIENAVNNDQEIGDNNVDGGVLDANNDGSGENLDQEMGDNDQQMGNNGLGSSLEEKREKMLQIFYDSQDFYLLKELEKLGPRKGVISQSFKDFVQSLWDAREEALIELKAIEQKYHNLQAELGQFADNDPATFEAMKEATKVAHEAANIWTDNIFTMRQWCSKNFPRAKERLEHLYNEVGITEGFDYLELPAVHL